jgi:hypothetical protein
VSEKGYTSRSALITARQSKRPGMAAHHSSRDCSMYPVIKRKANSYWEGSCHLSLSNYQA